MRGFNVGQNVYRDGLRENQDLYLDVANLSAIEVIKGPAAMLYGRIEPGGLRQYGDQEAARYALLFRAGAGG